MRRTAKITPESQSVIPTVRRHRPDYQIVLYMGILVLIGVVVLYAISPARVQLINEAGHNLDQAHFMQKQLMYLLVGLSAFAVASSIRPAWWLKYKAEILLAGIGACLLLAFLGIFLNDGIIIETGGATRWFDLKIVSFQPAELLKFGMLLFVASFLGRRMQQGRVNSIPDTLMPLGILVAFAALIIIVFQKDMGTGLTMLGTLLAMLLVSGINWSYLSMVLGGTIAAAVLLIVTSPHRIQRVITFFDPSSAGEQATYHINQAAIALGSGGLTGRGLGNSVQAFGYLPEAVNDSIFAILGETFGFIGLLVILILFYMLLKRILHVADHVADPTMKLIVVGVFGLIMTHVVVNVGAMTGVFPLTGVTLPFLSFGGTSLLFMMLSLGLVLQISRFTTHQRVTEGKDSNDAGTMRRRGIGRTRYASSRRYQ